MLPQNCPEMHFCLSVRFLRQHRIFRRLWNQLVKHSKMYFYPTMLFIVNDIRYMIYDIAGMISIWSRYVYWIYRLRFSCWVSVLALLPRLKSYLTSLPTIKFFWNLFWVVLAVNEVIFTNSNRVRANRKKVTQIRIIHYFRIPKFVEKKCYWSEILSNSFIYVTQNVSKYQIRVS